jgi:hypothetical protein
MISHAQRVQYRTGQVSQTPPAPPDLIVISSHAFDHSPVWDPPVLKGCFGFALPCLALPWLAFARDSKYWVLYLGGWDARTLWLVKSAPHLRMNHRARRRHVKKKALHLPYSLRHRPLSSPIPSSLRSQHDHSSTPRPFELVVPENSCHCIQM